MTEQLMTLLRALHVKAVVPSKLLLGANTTVCRECPEQGQWPCNTEILIRRYEKGDFND